MTGRARSDGGVAARSEFPRQWRRPTVFYNRSVKYLFYTLVVAFIVWSVWSLRIPMERLLIGLEQIGFLASNMFPPEFGVRFESGRPILNDNGQRILTGVIESLAMSFVATAVGVMISIPIAFMAAENLVPKPVYAVGRSIVTLSRSFHELVVAILLVKALGFGALAGAAALVFATPGFFAKLLAEDLEDIDRGQLEAIRASGGSTIHVWLYGVLPQVVPRIVGLTIYRWDINIRASTVIGIVGAGGIGITLINAFNRREYDFAMGIIIIIVAIVIVGEIVSAYARRRVQ